MTKEKLWTKTFISTSIVNFVLILSMYLLLVTMASYAMNTYGASTSLAGLVASIFIIGVLFGRLFAGKQIENIGTKKMLSIGISIFIILSFFYYFNLSIYFLIGIRIIQGIGVGLATTATGTIIAQVIPSSRNGEGIGYFSMSNVLATAIGPLVGVSLISTFDYVSIFIFSTTVSTVSLLLVLTIKEPKIPNTMEVNETTNKTAKFTLSSFFEKNALPISVTMLVVALAYSGILSFITTYANEINLSKAGGYYFLVYALIILLSRPITGKLMDLKGANSVAYPAIVLFAIGMVIISQADSSFTFLLGAKFIGLGYGNFQSCTQAVAIKVTPLHRMGLANSTYFIFLDFALGLGPLALGLLIPHIGFRGMYLLLSGIIMLSLFVYFILHGKKDKELLRLQQNNENIA